MRLKLFISAFYGLTPFGLIRDSSIWYRQLGHKSKSRRVTLTTEYYEVKVLFELLLFPLSGCCTGVEQTPQDQKAWAQIPPGPDPIKNSNVNLRWILLRQKFCKGVLGQKFWVAKCSVDLHWNFFIGSGPGAEIFFLLLLSYFIIVVSSIRLLKEMQLNLTC